MGEPPVPDDPWNIEEELDSEEEFWDIINAAWDIQGHKWRDDEA